MEEIGDWDRVEGQDRWAQFHGDPAPRCSFCGSMKPELFMELVEAGERVVPTDKNYKAYAGPQGIKFYFQHLSMEQRRRFIHLLNEGQVQVSHPGHFYVVPFFCRANPAG
jgi:hypothetical protein